MQTDGEFKGYIAFPEEEVSTWPTLPKTIEPKWFKGGRSRGQFVPLTPNPTTAVAVALKADVYFHEAAKAADSVTKWYVLEFTLTPDELMKVWKEGLLHWSSHMSGIEWWAPIDGAIGKVEWSLVEYDPIGFGSWAYTNLQCKYRRQPNPNGTCNSCGACNTHVFKATAKFEHTYYCAMCWRDFIVSSRPRSKLVSFEENDDMEM